MTIANLRQSCNVSNVFPRCVAGSGHHERRQRHEYPSHDDVTWQRDAAHDEQQPRDAEQRDVIISAVRDSEAEAHARTVQRRHAHPRHHRRQRHLRLAEGRARRVRVRGTCARHLDTVRSDLSDRRSVLR